MVSEAIDTFRVLTISLMGLAAGLSGYIFVLYARKLRKPPPVGRLIPYHVCLISLSHMMVLIGYGYEVYLRMGEPLTFRTPFALVASLLTLSALVSIGFYLRQAKPIEKRLEDDGDG